MKKLVKKIGVALFATALVTGCTGSFEEINTDPDAYTSVPYTNTLAYLFRYAGTQFGGDMDGYGTWAGYIVKIQYMDYLGGLIPSNNTYGNRWNYIYTANSQLKNILSLTESNAEVHRNIRLVSRLWMNYMWSYATDGWRDIPYSDALKGAEEDGGVLDAKYDKQEDIYPAVLADLKKVADDMAAGFGSDNLGVGDFIYDKDMKKWQKFCNSLRLRLAMRISGVAPDLAKSTIEEICGNPSKYPFITDTKDACYLWWQGSSPYFEPWYDNKRTRDDFGLSDIFIDHLKSTNDPRLPSLAYPATSDGQYRGFVNGASVQPQLNTISRIGKIYRDDPTGFTPFLKACESYYILAEAAMLGWNVGMTAQVAYELAVRTSMAENNVSKEDADAYLAGAGKWNNTKERIWWDQWVALFKNNYEAWALYRRTGIPSTNYPSLNSIYGTAHNDQPFRMPYPDNQYQYNKNGLSAVLDNVKDFAWGQQMWWDTRKGVY